MSYFSWRRPDAEVVGELDEADGRDADAQTQKTSNAGEEVHGAVQLQEIRLFKIVAIAPKSRASFF